MGLKDEIRQLRGEVEAQDMEDTLRDSVRKGAARVQDKVEDGLDAVSKSVRGARARVERAVDDTQVDTRMASRAEEELVALGDSLVASVGQVGAQIERIPARYPTLTALGALGIGLALGMSLRGRMR